MLPLLFSLVAVAVVLYLCYLFSKFISKKVTHANDSTNIRIVERVALAQDKGLALAEICGKYYLIGFSNNDIKILQEMPEVDLKTEQPAIKGNFLDIFNHVLKNRMDVTKFDRGSTKNDAGSGGESETGGEEKPDEK